MLKDNHGRTLNYLRLAVTDRCNLRCFYCMPEEGIDWLSRTAIMSYEEMLRVCALLVKMGISKIRITGGEPFVRKDIMQFLAALSKLDGLEQISITTNGVLTAPMVPDLKKIGVQSVNLSLDTLDRNRFFAITRRDEFPRVMETLEQFLRYGMDVKLNAVVMENKNIDDIIPLVELTKDLPIGVRFIEEMPFNGADDHYSVLEWNHVKILETIRAHFPVLEKVPDPPFSTSMNYHVPGFKGSVGIIAAYTRSFCGSCNRIRITPQGMLRTCLYDDGVLNIRDLMRSGHDDAALSQHFLHAFNTRAIDGREAENNRRLKNSLHESMATIGG